MYIVLEDFHDLEDFKQTKVGPLYHHYSRGDVFPRAGKTVKESRIYELATAENAQGRPLIALVVNSGKADESAAENADNKTIAEEKPVRKTRKRKKAAENSTVEKSSEKEQVMASAT